MWKDIGCPPRERRWIEEGVKFELICDEHDIAAEEVENAQGARDMALWVTLLLEELLELGVVEEVDDKPVIINALNVVPKANGKYRLILDLRPFNKYMKALKFSMETIQRIRPLIKQGDFMVAIDLRSAYHHLMVHPDHRRFCGFKWGVRRDTQSATGLRPRYFLFVALAFGSTQAPFVFQNVIWVVARYIRRKWGWRLSCYVDDIALFCQVQAMAEERGAAVASSLIMEAAQTHCVRVVRLATRACCPILARHACFLLSDPRFPCLQHARGHIAGEFRAGYRPRALWCSCWAGWRRIRSGLVRSDLM